MKVPRALTIAGSDSGGGAGVQADLKTFASLGVYGMTAVTAITAQNTRAVTGVQGISPEIVKAQIEAVVEDIGVDAAKQVCYTHRKSSAQWPSKLRNTFSRWLWILS